MENPSRLIIIALALLVIGVVLPFLMVMEMLASTIFLNLTSFVCSTVGLITGFIGIAQYRRGRK